MARQPPSKQFSWVSGGGLPNRLATAADFMNPGDVPANLGTQADYDRLQSWVQSQRAADARNKKWIKAGIIGTAALVTGGAAGAFAGGGVGGGSLGTIAGGSPWAVTPYASTVAMSGTSAAAGGGMGLAGWGKVGELAAGTFGNIYGANKASTANRQALEAQQRANTEAMQMAMADREESRRQFDIQMKAMQDDLAARNKFEGDRWAASEEERLYDRRLRDEREARRAPYRAASADALARMPALLASGRASPGMGTFGSFRR